MRIPRSAAVGITCLALGACGGSDKTATGNSAISATFHYGSPAAASSQEAGALAGPLTDAGLGINPATGLLFASTSAVSDDLLGSASVIPIATPAASRALTAPVRLPTSLAGQGFDNPACMTLTATTATFAGCTMTVDLSSGGNTAVLASTLDGTASATAGTFTWDLRLAMRVTASGTHSVAATVTQHSAGSFALTATTFVGHVATEVGYGGTFDGLPLVAGLDESLDVNVTYADAAACASRVTGGTLEAKRVWTARPAGKTAAQLPDAAAKVTWTACGQATVQLGTL